MRYCASSRFFKFLSIFIAIILAAACPGGNGLLAQTPPPSDNLKIVIIEGDNFTNNIKKRTSREPIVEVRDRNNRRVPGAAVIFQLPQSGPGGTFLDGSKVLNVITGSDGRAVARGLRPNNAAGTFQISITASAGGETATLAITQTNALAGAALATGAGTAGAGGAGVSLPIIAVIAGGAVAAGLIAARVVAGGGGKKAKISIGQPSLGQ